MIMGTLPLPFSTNIHTCRQRCYVITRPLNACNGSDNHVFNRFRLHWDVITARGEKSSFVEGCVAR